LEGEENHAGTTPMSGRKDALVAAADIVQFVNERAKKMADACGGSTVATVGSLLVHPGSVNVIPGKVSIGIDIRDGVEENMRNLKEEIVKAIRTLDEKYSVKATMEIPLDTSPCPCSKEMVDVIERVAERAGIQTKRMTSGAGHDAANMAGKAKAGMIFVPSVNGISHSTMEWTNWEDLEKGIELLSRVLKELSKIE